MRDSTEVGRCGCVSSKSARGVSSFSRGRCALVGAYRDDCQCQYGSEPKVVFVTIDEVLEMLVDGVLVLVDGVLVLVDEILEVLVDEILEVLVDGILVEVLLIETWVVVACATADDETTSTAFNDA